MRDKLFSINKLPDIPDNFIQNEIDITMNNIYKNYKYLIKDTFKIIELSVKEGIKKPLIMYNLFFGVELFLKMYLIRFSKLKLEEIENEGHNIIKLIELANSIDKKGNFEELKYLLEKFKSKENTKLIISKYNNFKYNHEKGNETLIFNFEIDENEKNKIKEVIEWINYYIQNS